jgi:hypothetical protein
MTIRQVAVVISSVWLWCYPQPNGALSMPRYNGPKPIRQGSKQFDDGAAWTNWYLFPRLNDNQVEDVIDAYDLTPWGGGPGQTYSGSAGVQHSKSYTLITQSGGWDV